VRLSASERMTRLELATLTLAR